MWRVSNIKLSIPQRLLLLTTIPIIGLIGIGGTSFRTLYSEYKNFAEDAQDISVLHAEVTDFVAFSEQLALEREAALRFCSHRDDAALLAEYRDRFVATDRAVDGLKAKMDRLENSEQRKLFTDKFQPVRTFFASQLPDARAGAMDPHRTPGEIYYIYMKLCYS